jgi:hypothetical protein|tara:strand:+ start:348 stop:1448 length:1101 start_codon:yes stop_codon:yes gene_type:complete
MDSFIKIVEQKKEVEKTVDTIHMKQIELIRRYISERKNVFICGGSGVGKSYILKNVLKDLSHVELQTEHLKSKSLFLPFIKPSCKHVFIEDYDPVFKPIIERVSDGDSLTRGSLLVTSTNMCMYPNFETVFVPKHKPDILLQLTDEKGPKAESAAYRSKGNIRNFFTYLDGYDEMDIFKTPKEFIVDVLSESGPIQFYDSISEHGHIWDIFQENYLDSEGVDILKASKSFSDADSYDTKMYSHGEWNLMPYFILHALTIPKASLGHPLVKDKIRPGSCWTKFGNYKMRKQKFDEINKKSRMGLGVEELYLLKNYAEKGDLSKLVEYKISPQDFDVINHLAVGNGLKSRDVTRVKKALKNVYEGRRT